MLQQCFLVFEKKSECRMERDILPIELGWLVKHEYLERHAWGLAKLIACFFNYLMLENPSWRKISGLVSKTCKNNLSCIRILNSVNVNDW